MSVLKLSSQRSIITTAFCALAALLGSAAASANCAPTASLPAAAPVRVTGFVPTIYRPGDITPRFVKMRFGDDFDNDDAPIVGLWEFRFSVPEDRSRNVPEDFGTVLWHADGTEATISGARPPSIGDVCQGVWRRTGRNTYTLSHVAMGWDLGSYTGVAHFHFAIRLDSGGNSYSGTFTRTIYQFNPSNPFDESAAVPVWPTATGSVTAKRVLPD